MPESMIKRTDESPRTYIWDFGKFPEIMQGEQIVAIDLQPTATPAGLTFGAGAIVVSPKTIAINGAVAATITGGANGQEYKTKCRVITDGGNKLVCSGPLLVEDP